MKPTLCSRCKKNLAVIFITKIENGNTVNEGLCLKCARELGIKPVDDLMQRMGITDDDLENLSGEMSDALGGLGMIASQQEQPDSDEDDDGQFDIPVEAPDRQIGDLLSLRQLMGALPEKDRMLLELRYFRELTQSKTAAILGMTQVQVSRREKKLLTQLRQELLS